MEKNDPSPPAPNRVRSIVSIVRPNHRRLATVLGLAASVALIIAVGIFLATRNNSSTGSGAAHLVLDSPDKNAAIVTDASGKQIYKLSYPQFSYLNYEASSPRGELLLSLGITTDGEGFVFSASSKAQTLPGDTTKDLHSAIVLDSSHHIFFSDEDNVVYITCPEASTCKLVSLNLRSAKLQIVADTGVKSSGTQLPSVYPLGLSPDHKTVYLRTLVANKLGSDAAAVYGVSLKGKVTGDWILSRNADYTPSLSPDAKQVVYKTGDSHSGITLTNLNLGSKQAFQAKWTGGEIADSTAALVWSPDSKKVLVSGSNSLLPRPAFDTAFDTTIGYLDTPSSQVFSIQTIKDSAHNRLGSLGWLDNSNVAYELDSSTRTYDFTTPSTQTLKLNIKSQSPTKLSSAKGSLKQIIFY